MKATKAIGFYICLVATILAAAGIALYGGVLYRISSVNALLIAAVVVGIATLGTAVAMGGKELTNVLPVVSSVLLIVSAGLASAPMVREIAYVYAGLNPRSNIQGYLTFMAVVLAAWVLSLIASFSGVTKRS